MEQNELPSKITALYCRTATPDPAAIEKQREELLLYAAEHGFENVQIFEDDGFSGLSDARPDFTRMNELIAARRVARVLTQKISRISRNIDASHGWRNNSGTANGLGALRVIAGIIATAQSCPATIAAGR